MIQLINGDCLEEMKKMPDNSVDSIVTDPPYGLSFMGKKWDYDVPSEDVWRECLRVLKPGGHLLSFAGTRTQHRMAVRIEDAGFEIRDMIAWVYGCLSEDTEVLTKDGFKHFHKITQDDIIRVYDTQNDIYKWEKPQRWSQYAVEQDTAYRIKSDTTDQIVSRNHNCLVEREGKLVFVKSEDLLQMERVPVLSGDIYILQEGQGEILHEELLWQGEELAETILSERVGQEASRNGIEWRKEPSVERGFDLQKEKGEICRPENKVCEMSERVSDDGEKGRVCNGTQIESSTGDTKTADKNGVCSSCQSRCNGQHDTELNAIQDERGTQEIRTRTTYNTTLATIEKIEYTGTIFCPTVSTGAFVARRNGQVFITGNSGFPKSLNIGKAVDKLQGNERTASTSNVDCEWLNRGEPCKGHGDNNGRYGETIHALPTKGTSPHEGWGTALKPALEPITVARKPLIGTVAENVLTHGTGGLNIDGCRVPANWKEERPESWFNSGKSKSGEPTYGGNLKTLTETTLGERLNDAGRFPANLIHDGSEEVVGLFPYSKNPSGSLASRGATGVDDNSISHSAARFFYCAKASKKDRDEGLEGFKVKRTAAMAGNMVDGQRLAGNGTLIATPVRANTHPTVKPTNLMHYLCRLVTPKGGTILDPFMGSGSTGKGAVKEGFNFIGIELDETYYEIAKARIGI